jgi:hypothetical protein
MAKTTPGISADGEKLIAKIYKLKDRAMKIVAQAEMLAAETKTDKKLAAKVSKIAAEARKLADDARPAKKIES